MVSYTIQKQNHAALDLLSPNHLAHGCDALVQASGEEVACYSNIAIDHNFDQDYFHDQSQCHHYDLCDYCCGLGCSYYFLDPLKIFQGIQLPKKKEEKSIRYSKKFLKISAASKVCKHTPFWCDSIPPANEKDFEC